MLNSLRAVEMLGGAKNKVLAITGQYSRAISSNRIESACCLVNDHLQTLTELYSINWKAQGDQESQTIEAILKLLEIEGCPDLFLKSITVLKPWTIYDTNLLQDRQTNIPFIFHPHPFKPSVFERLKGRMPSFPLYSRMKEIRKNLSVDLDEETKKRWRDILLINYPHKSLTNEEIRNIWKADPSVILLKESKGKFDFMEIDESKGA